MTLLMALGLALAPTGASHALGLGGLFSDAEVQVAIVEQSKDGVVLSVHGTDYKGRSPGIEIALNPAGYVGSGTRNTFIKSVVHNPADPGDWTVEFTLDAAQVDRLDPGTDYQIMTMRGGGRDVIDSHDTETAGVPLDFDALAQPSSDPSPEQPSEDTGSEGDDGSGGAGGSGGGTSSGRSTGGADEEGGAGAGSAEEPKAKKSKKPWSAPEEPPTVKGVELTGIDDASVDADDVIHAQASGFRPNETGIKVVVYSTPLVLSTDVKANGHGVAKWSGRLPKDIGLGEHTLTFQGSVNRGIRFVVTGTPSDGECVQSGCAPAAGAVKKPASAETGGVGGLTWIIVATMIVLALLASAVALLSGRRKREQDWEWDEPSYAQAPRYPSDPRQASGPYPAPSPRRLQAQQHQGQHLQGQHLQGQPQPEPPLARRDGHEPRPGRRAPQRSDRREPQPQSQPQPLAQPQQPPRRRAAAQQEPPVQRRPARRSAPQPAPQPVAQQAPQQPSHRQPRPPESFAPPSERPQAYAGQRVAGR